ncbi:MAG: DUF3256 family protein [Prevotella sp.]|nr:DUF3256 family protein [Prevotella sp.]
MMTIRNFFLFLSLLLAMSLSAQVTVRDVFKTMPHAMIPYLEENSKLDFIDFIDSGMKAEVTNALSGKSIMQRCTDKYLALTLNEASQLTMRLLPVSEPVDSASQVICLVRTYGTDIRESVVSFYSVNWRQLPASRYVSMPDGVWVASLGDSDDELTLTSDNRLNPPANKEQKVIEGKQIILKWNDGFVNKQ